MRRLTALIAVVLGLLTVALLPSSAVADVNDFSYSSWDVRFDVSLDDEGRAVAHVTETLVAAFPDFDQNRGIVRGYPQRYEGAGVSLNIVSVTDAAGQDVPYETEIDSDNEVLYLLTGTDDYVRGTQTYVIEYTMRDVMVTGEESGNDEFHWDMLALTSTQAVNRFHAEIAFSAGLAAQLTGDTACYEGFEHDRARCTLSGSVAQDGAQVFSVSSGARAAGDGVTVAIGFAPGTVTQPASRQPSPLADYGTAAVGGLSALAAAGAWVSVARLARRRRTATGIIIAQFDVPADLPPLTAAALLPGSQNPVPAQLVHLAVHGAIRLEGEADDDRPAVRLIDRDLAPTALDRAAIDAVFEGEHAPGALRFIPRKSTEFAKRMTKLTKKGTAQAAARDLTTKERSRAAVVFGWISVGLFAAALGLFIWSTTLDRELLILGILAMIVTSAIALVSAFVAFSKHTVLTPAGAEMYEYLLGVKEFIRVAETDRLRMLQSYRGAERRSDGSVDVVHLYEKLLPYAMLLGEEKTWGKVLDTAYENDDRSPGWIGLSTGVSINSRLSDYSSSVHSASTYTPSSSSAGGSTGGGYSGSGGGGGFSGGR
ncbi:DUF2207 domain-containing protein [Microbacterium esteraromaticum]|uniref:DUF2207 domain-containing protein n=1 Tax=Microbacterium esteraromaticum TaxID=57043 RepID=UPI001CD22817|nr:DUF2207 domain-containing protein [Microbacterium esteraromaticum]MCA1307119.1 DUF2207 domain-containing protein [Microbacterium esteraromaticum]